MKRTVIAVVILLALLMPLRTIPIPADYGVDVEITGIPSNGRLNKSMKCPPGVVPCDDDCTWTLTFTANINAIDGIDTVLAGVDGLPEGSTCDPPLTPCGGAPTTFTECTFTRTFAITCPGEKNSINSQFFTIKFVAIDCDGDIGEKTAKLFLTCYYCVNDMFVQVEGNGATTISAPEADTDVMIQFVVLNLQSEPDLIELYPSSTQPWLITPPFPSDILLGPDESEEFFVNVTVPAGTPAGVENIITLSAEGPDGLAVSANDTVLTSEYTSADPVIPGAVPYIMGNNRPNPFNPRTEISYVLFRSGNIRMDIIDVRGGLVTTLVDGFQSAGEQTVNWDGKNSRGVTAASGIYFCRLRSGNHTEVQKLVLLR